MDGKLICKFCKRPFSPETKGAQPDASIGPECWRRFSSGEAVIPLSAELNVTGLAPSESDAENQASRRLLDPSVDDQLNNILPVEPSANVRNVLELSLGRSFEPVKDPRDYALENMNGKYRYAIPFMKAGVASIFPGELLRFSEVIKERLQGHSDLARINLMAENEGALYANYPYNVGLEADMKAQFFLQTKRGDTYEGLLREAKAEAIKRGLVSEQDWAIIEDGIALSRSRLEAETIEVIDCPPDKAQGEIIRVADDKRLTDLLTGLPSAELVDRRANSLNSFTVAMREMVEVIKGKEMSHYSMGPGFISPAMKELSEQRGVLGVVFKTENFKLVGIKVVTKPSGEQLPPIYGPLRAGLAINLAYNGKGDLSNPGNYKTGAFLDESLAKGHRFHVTVSGAVCGPKDLSKLWDSGFMAPADYNTETIPSAETFVFERVSKRKRDYNPILTGDFQMNDIVRVLGATRIYFYPYDQTSVHPLNQGDLVYGTNDCSYHSAAIDPNFDIQKAALKKHWESIGNLSATSAIADDERSVLPRLAEKYQAEEAIVAAKYYAFLSGRAKTPSSNLSEEDLRRAIRGEFSSSTGLTEDVYARKSNNGNPVMDGGYTNIQNFLAYTKPLSERFSLFGYINHNNPVGDFKPTFWARSAENYAQLRTEQKTRAYFRLFDYEARKKKND